MYVNNDDEDFLWFIYVTWYYTIEAIRCDVATQYGKKPEWPETERGDVNKLKKRR